MPEADDLQAEINALRSLIAKKDHDLEEYKQTNHLKEQELVGLRATMDAVIDQMEAGTRAAIGFQQTYRAVVQRLDLMEKRVQLLSKSQEGPPIA